MLAEICCKYTNGVDSRQVFLSLLGQPVLIRESAVSAGDHKAITVTDTIVKWISTYPKSNFRPTN